MSTVLDENLLVSINPIFSYENTFKYSTESQQNEKSAQVYTGILWKGSLAGAVTVGEVGINI